MSFFTTVFDDLHKEIKNKAAEKISAVQPERSLGHLDNNKKISMLNIRATYSLKICSHSWVSILFCLSAELQWSVLTITWHYALQWYLDYLILKASPLREFS